MEKAKRGELQDSGGRGRFIAAVVLIGLGAYFLLAQFGVVSWDIVGTVFGTLGNLIGMLFGGIGACSLAASARPLALSSVHWVRLSAICGRFC